MRFRSLSACALQLPMTLAATLLLAASAGPSQPPPKAPGEQSLETAACLECHQAATPEIYRQWAASKHFGAGAGCFECHRSRPGAPGAMEHNGYTIHVAVTPGDCARCHPGKLRSIPNRHHAADGETLGALVSALARRPSPVPAVPPRP